MELRFKANKKQKLAFKYLFDDITTEIGYGGGAGGGKSYVGVSWVWMMCNKYPGTRYSFGRKELKRLKQTTLASYFKFLSDYNIPKAQEGIFNSQDSVIKFMNGSEILLLDLSYMPSDPLYTRLGSLELTGAFIDESAEIDEKAITILSTRVGRHNNEKYGLIPKILEGFNPDKGHVFRRFYMPYVKESLPEYRKFIPALATDNEFIPKSYIEQLEKTDEVTKQRLLYGNFMYDDTPGRLFMYDKILEMQTNDPFYGEKFVSCDPAREGRDSTIIIIWNGYVIQRVIQEAKSNMKDLKDRIYRLARENGVKKSCIIVDENGLGGGLVDELECQGFINNARQIEPKITTSQTKQLRLPNFEHLKTQCYYILSQLVNSNKIRYEGDSDLFSKLVEELDIVVQIDIDKDGKYRIMKKEDIKERLGRSPDIADCILKGTKILTDKGNIKIEDINIGDYVVTPYGKRRVSNKLSRIENKKLFELNSKLKTTGNHKIYTKNGFKSIDSLVFRDIIETDSIINLLLWRLKRLLNINERNIGFQRHVNITTQTNMNYEERLKKHFIEIYGKNTDERYKNDTTYTILIEMLGIIILKISIWFYEKSIFQTIGKITGGIVNYIKNIVLHWIGIEIKRKNGIEVTNDLNGINDIMESHYEKYDIKNIPVYIVEKIINLKHLLQNGVQLIVDKIININIKHITKKGIVGIVKGLLPLGNQNIQKIVQLNVLENIEESWVYDLEIERDNCYYANGILVSNCVMMRMFYEIRKPIDLSGIESNEYPLNINPYEVKIEPITFEIVDSAY